MHKRTITAIALLALGILFWPQGTKQYDTVIYGGGFAGCAAAGRASEYAPQHRVLLIVPETVEMLGGLGTTGGQNFADIRLWKKELTAQGSFARWFADAGQFYNTEKMAEVIAEDLKRYPNLEVLFGYELNQVSRIGKNIGSVKLGRVLRDELEGLVWDKPEMRIKGKVFIDASDEGRLARLSGVQLSVGRQDWPEQYLTASERDAGMGYQQAATLMFKVRNVKTPAEPGNYGEWVFSRDHNGSWGLAGGKATWSGTRELIAFNQKYAAQGFAIKPINAAQDGTESSEWWVNTLLVFDVDARMRSLDKETNRFPRHIQKQLTIEEAWLKAKEFIKNPDFMDALRRFSLEAHGQKYGFGSAELVLDEDGEPVTGASLYIRESVHAIQGGPTSPQGIEGKDGAYALNISEAQLAGDSKDMGSDRDLYPSRIGLGYYLMDINAYRPEDLQHEGKYVWPVTEWLRPDWLRSGGEPSCPVYLPYAILTSPDVDNLLLPGYAASCSSFAWAELRVLPNLAVLGDAAGIAAARSMNFGELPGDFGDIQIKWMQERLLETGARLEK